MNQSIRCMVILMLLMSTASVATAQCYTYCVVDNVIVGCCPQDYPTCCIVSGVFACCRFNNNNGTSTSLWRTQTNQNIKIDYVARLDVSQKRVAENP
jgi:hypothetical protein